MQLFRYATDAYGQTVLLGASWDLFWWFAGAGALYAAADALWRAATGRSWSVAATGGGGAVMRYGSLERLYHWVMALAMLTLLFTAFAPILGWKFEWVTAHWIAGLVLAALVFIHVLRAVFWQDFWAMTIGPADLRAADKPGKYELSQKLYHWAVAVLVLALVATGLLMLSKIDTPLWRRDPYWLSDASWGLIYALHDLSAMAVLALLLVHVYFGLRPDRFWILRAMVLGWITRDEYLAHHDQRRWAPSGRES
jgi:formate dehydrogenase subunit gamma